MRITAVMALISDMVIVFSTNYWIFLGGRIAVAMFLSGCYVATFTYGELLKHKIILKSQGVLIVVCILLLKKVNLKNIEISYISYYSYNGVINKLQ